MDDTQINDLINKTINLEHAGEKPNRGDKISDLIAQFGGSWRFILSFFSFVTLYIVTNLFVFSFDAYPFILLNLILACLAVFQAPFILMSQNRMNSIDRQREERSYKVSMMAEYEIKQINQKLDELINKIG